MLLPVRNIIFFLVFIVGGILLQIFLSKRENKWLGLLLPAVNTIFSILAVLGMAFFKNESVAEIITQVILVFLLWNIPTMLLIAIYLGCREKIKKNKEINKMSIQDLE